MRTTTLITAILAACTGSTSSDDHVKPGTTGDTGTPGLDSGGSGTPTDTSTTGTVPTGVLQGTLTGPSGPVDGADLRFCRGTLCRNGKSDSDGVFEFTGVPPVWHSFEAIPEDGFATVFVPLLFGVGETRTLDAVQLAYEDRSKLSKDEQELPVGAGLYLTVADGDLTPPLFGDDATEVAGVRVPAEDQVPTDGITGTVLAMWFVGPFDYAATDAAGIPLRIDDEWTLTDGTALEVYVGNYAQSAWLDCGPATASGGSITGAALPNLATVILVQP